MAKRRNGAVGSVVLRTDRRTLLRGGLGGLGALATGALSAVPAMARQSTPIPSPAPSGNPRRLEVSPGILVYPAHGTKTASPATEISIRGTTGALLGPVRVEGASSGGHSGLIKPHGDGRGVSFLPDAPFDPGEMVTVSADLPLRQGAEGAVTFKVASPAPKVPPPARRETAAPQAEPQAFRSRPDLRPPVINITTEAVDTSPGQIFLAPKVPDGQSGVMILDEAGELVWYAFPSLDLSQCNDFRMQEYLGQPVLTWWEGASPVGYGFGHFVVCNSSYERIAELQVGNGFPGGDVHEFRLTPQGTALVLIYNPVRWNLSPIRGAINGIVLDGVVQEIEIETGRVLFEWHALDHIDLEETYRAVPRSFGAPLDYVHLNSVAVDASGDLIVSGRHTNAIYKIGRSTGEIVWRLNGKRSDFSMGPGASFAYQHDAQSHPNGQVTLFDNAESDPKVGGTSRGVVLDLDLDSMRATLAREYIHPTEILSVSQGNMQMLPNGNVFIGWGSAPVFSEFGPDGDLRFNGRLPRGVMSYRAYRMPWSGHPAIPPDVAVEPGTGDALTVFASWNGATEVAAWRVLAGASAADLQMVGTSLRAGFETRIDVRTTGDLVAVQALDAAGRVLGTSDVTHLTQG